jgi:hypothetical protein
MSNSNNPTGNPACAVHQLPAPPHTPKYFWITDISLPPWKLNQSPLVLQLITYYYSENANIFIICIKMLALCTSVLLLGQYGQL